ncbi:L-ascorbate metabolism protein UlaG, beta-lactamase superfamily [Paracoccus isoporae]|uniref:L-ascorbate metabolism protein UlaG, beta-lactamase superfamily n=1 Tax=Paracoccus isoporae TaxID=591205 RepID=A0A1G6XY55_9RHOB|nr:metal-dependent hydrolase [Paracoccus isoporae]SDD83128.1 L-ascorbate metabolism protein UlaG, beta-lactamase superfamily [Paracoccus isoporae]
MRLTWLGHASWRLETETAVILIDPWLTDNPVFPAEKRQEAVKGATHILITHGHFDHASETVDLAKELGIPVAGIFDLMGYWEQRHGIEVIGFNKGGTVDLGGAKVTMVNATHSSSMAGDHGAPVYAGHESGYMIEGDGKTLYFSGDTDIMADMEWMGDLHKPSIGLLCVGGHFTMDPARAAYAAKRWFDFDTVICSHYLTFDFLKPDLAPLKSLDAKLVEPKVMAPFEV